MSPIIKLPGKTEDPKPKAKTRAKAKATPKPKAKAKAKPRAKRAATAAQSNGGEQRVAKDGRVLRIPKDLDPRVLDRFESQLADAGFRVKEAKAEHDAAIEAVHEIVVQAQDAEIPMAIIEDITGISRQWLYKMSQFKGRTASNSKSKPTPAKAKPAKSTRAATTTRHAAKRAANKTAKGSGPAIKLT